MKLEDKNVNRVWRVTKEGPIVSSKEKNREKCVFWAFILPLKIKHGYMLVLEHRKLKKMEERC